MADTKPPSAEYARKTMRDTERIKPGQEQMSRPAAKKLRKQGYRSTKVTRQYADFASDAHVDRRLGDSDDYGPEARSKKQYAKGRGSSHFYDTYRRDKFGPSASGKRSKKGRKNARQ